MWNIPDLAEKYKRNLKTLKMGEAIHKTLIDAGIPKPEWTDVADKFVFLAIYGKTEPDREENRPKTRKGKK